MSLGVAPFFGTRCGLAHWRLFMAEIKQPLSDGKIKALQLLKQAHDAAEDAACQFYNTRSRRRACCEPVSPRATYTGGSRSGTSTKSLKSQAPGPASGRFAGRRRFRAAAMPASFCWQLLSRFGGRR